MIFFLLKYVNECPLKTKHVWITLSVFVICDDILHWA